MHRIKQIGAAAFALALAIGQAGTALAQTDDGFCRNGMFAEENTTFGLARIVGKGKSRFYEDMKGCPVATAACLQKSYVLPGDRVVTGRSKGEFVCAFYPNKVGGSAGWMPRSRLAAIRVDPAPPLARWLGRWSEYDNWVRFTRKRNGLHVEGEAFWPSANPPLSVRPGGPNMGGVVGPVTVSGNRAFEPECKVSFHLLGDILVVADPSRHCDGMNVAFTGVYQRSR
jgi:hypothetical protein